MVEQWAPPGPGTWELDATHYPASVSRLVRDLMEMAPRVGLGKGFDLLGAPLATMDVRFVKGRMYRRLVPLIGGDRSGTPPAFVLWIATRVHPAFRRRAATAERSLRGRAWLDEFRRWEQEWKPELVAANRAFGAVDPTALDDAGLARHLAAVVAHLERSATLHFRLHTSDLGPIGLLLVRAREWGLDERKLMDVLSGSSPSTSAPAMTLASIRDAVRATGDGALADATSLEDLRAASDEVAGLIDEYLDQYGSRLTTGYDISDLTLAELPEVVLASIRDERGSGLPAVDERADDRGAAACAELRSTLSAEAATEFDELVEDARLLYGLRDENGPITYEWPAGIVRRSVVEAGRRLRAAGRIVEVDHVFDLAAAEIAGLLIGEDSPSSAPTSAEVAARHAERQRWCTLEPPLFLGAPPTEPPIDVLPGAMRTMMRVTLAVTTLLEADEHAHGLAGTGIGVDAYTGTARVVIDADDALDRVDPGDVIIARLTVPTFNSVLAIAGAVVTENGGLLCHTAVIARELGIPAVVGVADALTAIPDGATVTVDPIAGTVTVHP